MEDILIRLQKLEDEVKRERDINRTLQLQISEMNEEKEKEKNQNTFDSDKYNELSKKIVNIEKNLNQFITLFHSSKSVSQTIEDKIKNIESKVKIIETSIKKFEYSNDSYYSKGNSNRIKLSEYVSLFCGHYQFNLFSSGLTPISNEEKKIILLYSCLMNSNSINIIIKREDKYKVFKNNHIRQTHFSARDHITTFDSLVKQLEKEFIGYLIPTPEDVGYVYLNGKYYIIGNYEKNELTNKTNIRCYMTNKLLSNSFEEIFE
jgi:hypothetical protein